MSEMMMSENRSLIVYFSRTGSTRAMARIIHLNVTAALHEIRTTEPYPLDYQETVEQARQELENGILPKLQTRIRDMEDYRVIFLGFPVWWETLPMPVVSHARQDHRAVLYPRRQWHGEDRDRACGSVCGC